MTPASEPEAESPSIPVAPYGPRKLIGAFGEANDARHARSSSVGASPYRSECVDEFDFDAAINAEIEWLQQTGTSAQVLKDQIIYESTLSGPIPKSSHTLKMFIEQAEAHLVQGKIPNTFAVNEEQSQGTMNTSPIPVATQEVAEGL